VIYIKCPICNIDWSVNDKEYASCNQCYSSYYFAGMEVISIVNILNKGDELSFYYNCPDIDNTCIYYSHNKLDKIVLPILDINIAANKLKTLITFS